MKKRFKLTTFFMVDDGINAEELKVQLKKKLNNFIVSAKDDGDITVKNDDYDDSTIVIEISKDAIIEKIEEVLSVETIQANRLAKLNDGFKVWLLSRAINYVESSVAAPPHKQKFNDGKYPMSVDEMIDFLESEIQGFYTNYSLTVDDNGRLLFNQKKKKKNNG